MFTELTDFSNSPANINPKPIHYRHLYVWSSLLCECDEGYEEKTSRLDMENAGLPKYEECVNEELVITKTKAGYNGMEIR